MFKYAGIFVLILSVPIFFVYALSHEYKTIWVLFSAFTLMEIGRLLYRIGKADEQLSLEDKLQEDSRQPVLLLRSFERDDLGIRRGSLGIGSMTEFIFLHPDFYTKRNGIVTFEEVLIPKLEKVGPVIALGRPDEKITTLGASRAYVPHDNWKEKITELIIKSKLIVIILDYSNSIIWEIEEIISHKPLIDILILIPPKEWTDETDWLTKYNSLQKQFTFLPTDINLDTVAISFDNVGTPCTMSLDTKDTLSKIDNIGSLIEKKYIQVKGA